MQLAVLIPARGGSKGLVRKNILAFNGQPLISWSILNALQAKCVSEVFVSTDCPEISAIAQSYGATVVHRPSAFATDTSTTEEVISHFFDAVSELTIEHLCLLQCTSPIRRKGFVDEFFASHIQQCADSSLSAARSHRFFWNVNEGKHATPLNYDPVSRPRRQDINLSQCLYEETGSGYIFSREGFYENKSRLYGNVGIFETSWSESFEIDSKQDFLILEEIHKLYLMGELDD